MDTPVFIPIVALCIVGLLGWAGCFRRDALLSGPSRDAGLVPADLLVGLGLMVVGASLAGLLMRSAYFGAADIDPAELSTMDQAKRVLLTQAMGQLPIVLYMLWRVSAVPGGPWRVGLIPSKPRRDLGWGLLGFVVSVPLVMGTIQTAVIVGQWFGQEPPAIGHEMLRLMSDSDSLPASVLLMCSAVIVAPVLEEAIFRGLFQSVMAEVLGVSMRWPIVGVSAMVFSLIHVGAANWQTLPGLFVLGVVLAWLYERSGSLWPGIVAHMGFNALNIAIMLSMNTPPEVTSS
jgi:membrane protease YdiL (CAAX protease family)